MLGNCLLILSAGISLSCVLEQQETFVSNDYWYKFSQAASIMHWNEIE